jgi:SAM-dependent methyltransferase
MDNCPFCHSPMALVVTSSVFYHECSKCCFRFLDTGFHVSARAAKERYELHDNSNTNEGYGKWIKGIMDFGVFPFMGNNGTFLDYGCGAGQSVRRYLHDFAKDHWQYSCYDIHFFPDKPSGSFSMLFCCETAEHFTDPENNFQEMIRYLEPDGILVISTLFAPANRKEFEKWWYRQDCTHTSFYTSTTLKAVAERFNLVQLADNGRNIQVFRKGK